MKAIIDGDIVCYRAACSAIGEEQWVALARADKTIQDLLTDTHADSYCVYLTGTSNFRKTLDPLYKAHRPEERPEHWSSVREFLVAHHNGIIVDGYEADDALGIAQDKSGGTTVLCSIDKDLLQVPGYHYNFVKKEFKVVTHEEGIRALYMQSLVGDRSDNIQGVRGIGPVKAANALRECLDEYELFEKCRELYNDDTRFFLNMHLLYIWRKPGDSWIRPTRPGEPAAATEPPKGEDTRNSNAKTQEA